VLIGDGQSTRIRKFVVYLFAPVSGAGSFIDKNSGGDKHEN
jgi:hypothetical protein